MCVCVCCTNFGASVASSSSEYCEAQCWEKTRQFFLSKCYKKKDDILSQHHNIQAESQRERKTWRKC